MATQKQEPVLSITRFFTGMVTQRSPLNTPFAYAGLNMVQRQDALIGGLNVELTNNFTLVRRPGFPRYCSVQFAVNEFPLAYTSARINGQVVNLVDTNLAVYTFTRTSKTLLFTKSAGAGQTHFQQIGGVIYFANGMDNKKWAPPKTQWAASTNFALGTLIIDSNGNVQQVTTAGTSGAAQPGWSATPITGTTADGTGLVWTCRGSQVSNWGIASPAAAPTLSPTLTGNSACRFWWPGVTLAALPTSQYSIIDSNGNVQFLDSGVTTGATIPVWSAVPQTQTFDNGVPWGCLASPVNWTPSTQFFNTQTGTVIDSNGNLQAVLTGGASGTSEPTWNTFGLTTTDGTVTWINMGSAKLLASDGYQWVFAYHTCYGHVSTASPVTLSTGPIIGSTFTVPLSGQGSPDPQCDAIWIFRIRDGGALFEFAGSVPNPGNIAWNFTDTLADADLEDQIIAAQDHLNDPPPAGLTVLAYHEKRIFGGVGNTMQFSVGPDGVIGVQAESWPPANLEIFATDVQQFAPTTQGLCLFTHDEWWVYQGGPQTASFDPVKIADNFGISSPNCLVQDGDQLYLYTTQRQLWSLTLQGKDEEGFAIGDILAGNPDDGIPGFAPDTTYLALHRNGTDVGLWVSDGSTNLLRYSLTNNCWSTAYQPIGGVRAIGSVETSIGTYALMAGRATGDGYILSRSLSKTKFYDDTSDKTYQWNAQIGSIHFSQAAQKAEDLASIVLQTTGVGTQPNIAVRINEIAGNFIDIPAGADDPHDAPSKTAPAKRYDLQDMQQMVPNEIRHMQVQISGIAENARNEILGLHFCPQVDA